MRTCPFCAATNADDAPYCATCGRSGVPAAAAPPPSPPPTPPSSLQPGWPQQASAPPPSPQPPWPPPPYRPTAAPFAPGPITPGGAPAEPSGHGPLVLVITSTVAALLLMVAAYLGSIAPPAESHVKQIRPGVAAEAPAGAGSGAHGR